MLTVIKFAAGFIFFIIVISALVAFLSLSISLAQIALSKVVEVGEAFYLENGEKKNPEEASDDRTR